jgi:uncharacterized protein YqgV (UPF0045/DUF77 family)
MNITAEVSLYPLEENYGEKIMEFLHGLHTNHGISVETSAMSTLLTGDYETIMKMLNEGMQNFFENHKAVCILKISNGCMVNEL